MNIRTLASLVVLACCALAGCTTARPTFPETAIVPADTITPPDPTLDHYIAWVPSDVAETATVARAVTHISLGRAREQTAAELCNEERLVPAEVASVTGPFPATRPDGDPVWYYRISHQPGLRGCTDIDAAQLFQAMQGNLPAWIHIEPATAPYSALGLLE
jgi:hypothetical protein